MTAAAASSHLSAVVAEHVSHVPADGRRNTYVECAAEAAECTCPEFCERDHDND